MSIMQTRARIVLCGVGLGLAALPGPGHAQSASGQAQRPLDPVITTQLNLATCREQNHQLASAWGAFVEAARMARAAGNDKLLKVATGHARKLEPRLSRVTIAVTADHQLAGLVVMRDKETV